MFKINNIDALKSIIRAFRDTQVLIARVGHLKRKNERKNCCIYLYNTLDR